MELSIKITKGEFWIVWVHTHPIVKLEGIITCMEFLIPMSFSRLQVKEPSKILLKISTTFLIKILYDLQELVVKVTCERWGSLERTFPISLYVQDLNNILGTKKRSGHLLVFRKKCKTSRSLVGRIHSTVVFSEQFQRHLSQDVDSNWFSSLNVKDQRHWNWNS